MAVSRNEFGRLLNHYAGAHERSLRWIAGKIGEKPKNVERWAKYENIPGEANKVIRLADVFELKIPACDELLAAAGFPALKDVKQDIPIEDKKTYEAVARIEGRSAPAYFPTFPDYGRGTLTSPNDIKEGDIIPREHLSDGQLIPIIEEAKKKNLRLEPKVFYVVISTVAVTLIIVTTLVVFPAARETAVRIVTPIVERVSQFIKRFEPSPQPTRTVPTSTPTATTPLTPTVTPLPTIDTVEATPVAISSTGINIRRGPGTEYEIIQTSNSGERLPLIGKNPEGTWWNVIINGTSGWVSSELVSVQNADGIPVVNNYPPPPSTVVPVSTPVTPTPSLPTATPTPAPTNASSQQNLGGTLETRELASFSQIILSIPGNLLLIQEASSSITIDAPENVRSIISTRVEGNTLLIGANAPLQLTNTSIQYRLSTPNIAGISVSGTAQIHANNINADSLHLTSDGTTTIDISTLSARNIAVNISGTGKITISSGEVGDQNVRIDTSGNFSAGNLHANKAIAQVGGTGKATVWVDAQLEATVSGTGIIEYYGLPTVSQNSTALGKVQSLGAK